MYAIPSLVAVYFPPRPLPCFPSPLFVYVERMFVNFDFSSLPNRVICCYSVIRRKKKKKENRVET